MHVSLLTQENLPTAPLDTQYQYLHCLHYAPGQCYIICNAALQCRGMLAAVPLVSELKWKCNCLLHCIDHSLVVTSSVCMHIIIIILVSYLYSRIVDSLGRFLNLSDAISSESGPDSNRLQRPRGLWLAGSALYVISTGWAWAMSGSIADLCTMTFYCVAMTNHPFQVFRGTA